MKPCAAIVLVLGLGGACSAKESTTPMAPDAAVAGASLEYDRLGADCTDDIEACEPDETCTDFRWIDPALVGARCAPRALCDVVHCPPNARCYIRLSIPSVVQCTNSF